MILEAKTQGVAKYILLTGLLSGTIDALSAIVINPGVPAATIFRFIASGFFGRLAFTGGTEMVIYGILFHYLIAFVWTTLIFRLYPFFITTLGNKYILMFVFGLLIWVVMNMLILPLSHVRALPFDVAKVFVNIAALIVAFGIPITLIADKYYGADLVSD